jgi:hypothetical protein
MSVWKMSTLAVNAIKKVDHIAVRNDISQALNC